MHLGGLITTALLGYLYNIVIDKYGNHKVSQWTSEKVPLDIRSEGIVYVPKSVDELRRTISKRSGLVEKTSDRKSWNAWLTSESREIEYLKPGNYTFAYRSYVNFEEAGAIKKSLFHLRTWLGFIAQKRGMMTIHPDGEHVSITDWFRKRFSIFEIKWNGIVEKSDSRIAWTDTEMVINRKEKIVNPPACEALRKIPWDIIKGEDGLFAFRRGDAGMLAYDKKPVW
mmetsp:Transcript_12944/g.19109  ORF Transcript_12944/g.19109 Transcript_12944/m.19109 type:complete len:226 (-) Transcript_12944:8-685(-)